MKAPELFTVTLHFRGMEPDPDAGPGDLHALVAHILNDLSEDIYRAALSEHPRQSGHIRVDPVTGRSAQDGAVAGAWGFA